MKTISMKLNLLTLLLIAAFAPALLPAQDGYSSASLSMGKMQAAARAIPAPSQVVIEEYVNYHRHRIALPESGQGVALDLQWGAPTLSGNPAERILQVGIATGKAASLDLLPPVNVVLVIDKSGSMRGERIARAREAAHTFLDRLRPGDIFSLVAFDHSVEVLVPAAPISDKTALHQAIDRIRDEGSTNLDLGMLTGYEQLVRHQKRGQTNRLIMLTDALTNTGITDPNEIVRHSQYYVEDFEVDFTVVGVGVDFNAGLSRQLTGSAHSSIFFINDPADIQKVFIDEVESLLSVVGRDVVLEVELPVEYAVREIFGYRPTVRDNRISIPLENLNSGLSMVALIRLERLAEVPAPASRSQVKARLRYFDPADGQNRELKATRMVNRGNENGKTEWEEVSKNYHIALMASALRKMAELVAEGKSREAALPVNRVLDQVHDRYRDHMDADIRRVLDILNRYAGELAVAE